MIYIYRSNHSWINMSTKDRISWTRYIDYMDWEQLWTRREYVSAVLL